MGNLIIPNNMFEWWLGKLRTHGSVWIYAELGIMHYIKIKVY